jgi:threonine aldolase
MINDSNPSRLRQFTSDTYAGVCPEALQAMEAANCGHVNAYGNDEYTRRAARSLGELFDTECRVFFVSSGTAANALALASLCQPYHSVFCHADSHLQTDECGAPEFFAGGIKLIPIPGASGKLEPAMVRQAAAQRRDVHSSKPHVLSLSQATEAGTLYTVAETGELGNLARELGLRFHMDGARLANALAALGVSPRALTWEAGVDVLCFGGTKNGLALGDALVFFNLGAARDFEYRRKQAGHLLAKMRFVSAAWLALLESAAWLRNAQHANLMARRLEAALRRFARLEIVHPVEANAVFVRWPPGWSQALHQRGWHFYTIAGGARLMCSWDTQEEDIAALVNDLRELEAKEHIEK